jgi:hypothetical protein
MTQRVRLLIVALAVTVCPGLIGAQAPRNLVATRDLFIDANRADILRAPDLLVARNGDMIMRQMLEGFIRYFDARGAPATFGRQGDGPNEFRNIRAMGFLGDTIWAADISHRRVTFISPSRSPLRTVDYPSFITTSTPNGAQTTGAAFPLAIYSDGSYLMYTSSIPVAGGGGGTRGSAPWRAPDTVHTRPFVRTRSDGQFMNVVIWRPDIPDCGVRFRTTTGGGQALIPFCAGPLEAVSSDGDRVAIITSTVASATTGSYRLIVMGVNGDTIVGRTISYRPVAIPREKNDSVVAARIGQLDSMTGLAPENKPLFVQAYRTMPLRTHYPPVRSIVIGRDKTIWLENWTPVAERSWQVLDPRGNPVAIVKLPSNVTLLNADLTMIWGVETDVDGLISVVRYRLAGAGEERR